MNKIVESGNSESIVQTCKPTLKRSMLVVKQLAAIFNEDEPKIISVKINEDGELYSGKQIFHYTESIPNVLQFAWAVYSFDNLKGILIRNSWWDTKTDVSIMKTRNAYESMIENPTIRSQNTFISSKSADEVKSQVENLMKNVTAIDGYIKDETQDVFNYKSVYFNNFDYNFRHSWNYPLTNQDMVAQVNEFIRNLESCINSTDEIINRIELDYLVPLDVYYQHISG